MDVEARAGTAGAAVFDTSTAEEELEGKGGVEFVPGGGRLRLFDVDVGSRVGIVDCAEFAAALCCSSEEFPVPLNMTETGS
jgi:hypothetical protein